MDPIFPPKPNFKAKEDSRLKVILSICFFLISFYWLLDQDIFLTLVLALALFIHELGHYLAMKRFDYGDLRIFFLPFLGVVTSGKKQLISQKERTIILMSGPLPGIIIGIAAYLLGSHLINDDLKYAGMVFIFLNVFKLLPISPLDGGDLINTLFFNQKEKLEIFFSALSGIAVLIICWWTDYYRLMIIPIVLVYMLFKDFKMNQLKSILKMDGIDYNKTYNELSNREYWEIRKKVIEFWTKYKKIDSTEFVISEKEESIVKEIKSITRSSVKADMSTKAKMAVILCCLFINLLPYPIIKSYVENQNLLKTELPN